MPKRRRLIDHLTRIRPDIEEPESAIRSGKVFVDNRLVTNPHSLVSPDASIVIRVPPRLRGRDKLQQAIRKFDIMIEGRIALDVGAAAGGFTKALLEAGARRVYAVDVGHGQLLGSLRQDTRVVNLEAVNLADLNRSLVPGVVEVITLDLSYLAVAAAVPQLESIEIDPHAHLIALVKPQFELGLSAPPTRSDLIEKARLQAHSGIEVSGWTIIGSTSPAPLGARGAIEFFLHARRTA